MWEPNAGSVRPQCSQCRSTSKRLATEEEIAAYRNGAKIAPGFQKTTTGDENPDAESRTDSTPSTADPRVDPVDVERLIKEDIPPKGGGPSPAPGGWKLIGTGIAVLGIGALVGWFLLSRWRRAHDLRRRTEAEEVEDLPPAEYVRPRFRVCG